MDQAISREIGLAERREIFHEQYGNQIDAGITLAEIVTKAGDYLSRIVGSDDADAAMARIVAGVVEASGNLMETAAEWRGALDKSRSNCFSEWPLGGKLHDLAAYAIYGIVLDEEASSEQ